MADLQTAHIWGAKFPGGSIDDLIFEEMYGDDETPISKFAESQGETFYDHDFFYVEPITDRDVREMLESGGVPAKNAEIIAKSWRMAQMDEFNAIVVGDEEDFSAPRSCTIDGVEFRYVGLFPHWSTKG